jgi:hypothetical protein
VPSLNTAKAAVDDFGRTKQQVEDFMAVEPSVHARSANCQGFKQRKRSRSLVAKNINDIVVTTLEVVKYFQVF